MHIRTDERTYLTLVHLTGKVGAEGRHRLWQAVDGALRADPLAVVWDLTGVEEIHDQALAVLAGGMAFQRLREDPVILMGAKAKLVDRLRQTGVIFEAAIVSDEQEACLAILERLHKKYDEFFCKIVVEEGFLSATDLKQALLLFDREGRSGDFGRLLLREGMIRAPQLLDAVCRQKTLLGDILVESGTLNAEELELALQTRRGEGEKLGDLLLRLGLATNKDIYEALGSQFKRRRRIQKSKSPPSSPDPAQASPTIKSPGAASQRARLGDILLEKHLLSPEDLERSLQLQRQTRGREKLGDILVRLGFVSDSELYKALLTQYQRHRGASKVSVEVRGALEALIAKLGKGDPLLVRQACEGLMTLGGPAFSVLVAALRNPTPPIRRGAADVLGCAMAFSAIPALLERMEDPIPRIRNECFWALIRITGQNFPQEDLKAWTTWWSGIDPRTLPPAPDTVSSHREEMARLLSSALDEERPLDAFDIEYRAGNEEWEGGHTRLYLRGDGRTQVFHVVRGQTSTFLGDLGASETRTFFEAFSAGGILFVDSSRSTNDPAETRHELALRIGNRYYRRSMLYYRELFQHWSYRSYETRIRDLIRRVTRGTVL
jgi:ABC-type transporter Mla MlaB component